MLKKCLLSLVIFQSLLVSTSQAAQCDLRVPPVIKYWTKGKVAERLYGRFDATHRKYWVDIIAGIGVPIMVGFFWFINASHDFDLTHVDHDSLMEAQEQFMNLKWACHTRILDAYKSSIIYNHNRVYVSDSFYCSKPGVNGVYGALPGDNDGNGNQYFIDIKRGEPVFDRKATRLKKCQKIASCMDRANDSIELEDLMDVAKKLKCPKRVIEVPAL